MIKYKIKRKIVDCEKMESVTSHDLYPLPPVTNCHTFSDPLPPFWSVTYFMDGPSRSPIQVLTELNAVQLQFLRETHHNTTLEGSRV